MADIFLSYSRTDKARAATLVAALEARGWSVWWDREVSTGEEFDRVIGAALDAARAVIVIWSPASVESRWVRGEARVGADRGILIPVRFEQATLPIDVRAIHTTDLDHWNGDPAGDAFVALEQSLAKLIEQPAAPALAAAPPELQNERRRLTVLSCSFTRGPRAARLDPEEWRAPAAQFRTVVGETAARFGGHVARTGGDNQTIYFGYPVAQEDAAERAAQAGLAIIGSLAEKKAQSGGSPTMDMTVRVGVHAGTVVVSHDGPEVEMFGEAPDLAARVRDCAEPDALLVTGAVQELIAGLFLVEEKGALPADDRPEPTPLFRVISAGLASRRSRGVATHGQTPFVGREEEAFLLSSRWNRARDGEGQLVLVMGEPGIGKTRLIEEFRGKLKSDPHLWVACTCEAMFDNTPFHAVIQMLHQGLGWRGDEAPQGRLDQLERALQTPGVRIDEALPLIGELLGLPVPQSYSALKYPPEQKRGRLFAALAGWLFSAARLQPVVILIEDLHWADPSTFEWLQMLADQGASAPLMLLCTARPQFQPSWPMRAHHVQLTLSRLNERQTREMVAGYAAHLELAPDVVEAVVGRTDGVPLFAEELTRLMLDGERQASAREIPATLQDSLTSRLDRLGSAKTVAQIGSVIGREFSYALLDAVASLTESSLQSALTKLVAAEVIQARGFPPDATYQFKHALMQDAAYDALLKSRRSELHGRVAETLQTRFPELAAAQPELLARHLTRAGNIEPAIAAWVAVAKAADARSAFREAEEAYRQALALVGVLPEATERDAREMEILVPLIVVAASSRGWGAGPVVELNERAGDLAEKSGNLLQVVIQRFAATAAAIQTSESVRAAALSDQVFDLAVREGGDLSMRCGREAKILGCYGAGDFAEVELHFSEWSTLCGRAGYGPFPGETSAALTYGAMCAWHLGRADLAQERLRQAVEFGRQSANPVDLQYALGFAGTVAMMSRVPDAALATAGEGLALAKTHDLASAFDDFAFTLAWANAQIGEPERHIEVMREIVGRMIADGQRGPAATALLRLAHALKVTGAHEEALAAVEQFLTDYPDQVLTRPTAFELRGQLRVLMRHPDMSERDFRQAMAAAQSIGTKPPELRAATSLAHLLRARGEAAAARELLKPLFDAFTEGFDTPDLQNARQCLEALEG